MGGLAVASDALGVSDRFLGIRACIISTAGHPMATTATPEVIATMLHEHEVIVRAIRAQDAEGAALAMRWHLWEGRRRLMP